MSEIITVPGKLKSIEAICIHRVGDIGVTRANDMSWWTLTDMPSGVAVPFHFDDREIAIMAADEINESIDWRATVDALAVGKQHADVARAIEILKEYGGVRSNNTPATPEELSNLLSQ